LDQEARLFKFEDECLFLLVEVVVVARGEWPINIFKLKYRLYEVRQIIIHLNYGIEVAGVADVLEADNVTTLTDPLLGIEGLIAFYSLKSIRVQWVHARHDGLVQLAILIVGIVVFGDLVYLVWVLS